MLFTAVLFPSGAVSGTVSSTASFVTAWFGGSGVIDWDPFFNILKYSVYGFVGLSLLLYVITRPHK